ncbi:hypothetical protein [Mycolicibacter kumamotonensis]|uniref:PE-PGRS family protein n=1 Tax=Mycolicibacter kumamotonensis TaxID=354243 RepID=A0A1B8SA38_9MYCO|nr:hypothetical protein [Mycolicibacter kumamotonensis]OBY29615.1 hypothetical protein ACT18_22060 [Mycolicibacter kumamotonensis]
MRRDEPLSSRQLQVLRWISEGCPDGVWSDFSYKTTAYALSARGLVVVRRRRKQWAATITQEGAFYLAHGHYRSGPEPGAANAAMPPRDPDDDILSLAEQLVAELRSGNGIVVVRAPSQTQRARYRRAIHRLIIRGQVPDGFVLRHTGRDAGDLTIRLIRAEADEHRPEPPPRVAVPGGVDEVSPEVKALAEAGRLAITPKATDRALRILQAIANECAARVWSLELQPTDDRRLCISTDERAFDLTLTEEMVDQEVPDDDQLKVAKYDWQRVPLAVAKVGSGRLTLQLEEPYARKSWSDRRRWTLDEKLGVAFSEMEWRVDEAARQRRRREDDLLHRQLVWDAAVPVAKEAYVDDLNRRRLLDQAAQHSRAQALRDYSRALKAVADAADDSDDAAAIHRWAGWSADEADRTDPIKDVKSLHYAEPDDLQPGDYDKFMPKGMSAYRRPWQ